MNLREKLQVLFDEDSCWYPKGEAFVWVSAIGENGKRYAGCRMIKEEKLNGRNFRIVEHHNGKLEIELLDSIYDPKTYKHSDPIW